MPVPIGVRAKGAGGGAAPPVSKIFGQNAKNSAKKRYFFGQTGRQPPSLENIRAKRQKFSQKKRNFLGKQGAAPPKSDRARMLMQQFHLFLYPFLYH